MKSEKVCFKTRGSSYCSYYVLCLTSCAFSISSPLLLLLLLLLLLQYIEAVTLFTSALASAHPAEDGLKEMLNRTQLLQKRAECLLRLKRPRAAVNDCSACLRLHDQNSSALKCRGIAYRQVCTHLCLQPPSRLKNNYQKIWKLMYASDLEVERIACRPLGRDDHQL